MKDKEKFLHKLLGKNGSFSNDYLHSFQVLMEFAFLSEQNNKAIFFTLLVVTISRLLFSYFQLLDIEGKYFAQIELAFETVVG